MAFVMLNTGLFSEPSFSSLPFVATKMESVGNSGSGWSFNPGMITSIVSPVFSL